MLPSTQAYPRLREARPCLSPAARSSCYLALGPPLHNEGLGEGLVLSDGVGFWLQGPGLSEVPARWWH